MLHSWYMVFSQLPWLPEQLFRRRNWRFGRRFLAGTAHPGTFSSEEVDRYVAIWAKPRTLTSMINWHRCLHYAGRLNWSRIKRPLQIIWGKQDAFLKARLAEISMTQCKNGQLHFFPKATHWVQLQEPDAVNDLLLKFIAASPATT
jgi:pimeloyl-ACP methyl ester carboxylesterase